MADRHLVGPMGPCVDPTVFVHPWITSYEVPRGNGVEPACAVHYYLDVGSPYIRRSHRSLRFSLFGW